MFCMCWPCVIFIFCVMFSLKICLGKPDWGYLWIFHMGLGLMDTSVSPGNSRNALPRSSAVAPSSTECQQALTVSLVQRNLHKMVPAPGSMGPLKIDGSIRIHAPPAVYDNSESKGSSKE